MKYKLLCGLALGILIYAEGPGAPPVFNVQSYGADGSGKSNVAAAINRAIDAAHLQLRLRIQPARPRLS